MTEPVGPLSLVGEDGVLNVRYSRLAVRTVFVSGYPDLTTTEFEANYALRLFLAHQANATFLVGDASGCDSMAQGFLQKLDASVIVFHVSEVPLNNVAPFETRGGFGDDAERDRAMSEASTESITWVRPEVGIAMTPQPIVDFKAGLLQACPGIVVREEDPPLDPKGPWICDAWADERHLYIVHYPGRYLIGLALTIGDELDFESRPDETFGTIEAAVARAVELLTGQSANTSSTTADTLSPPPNLSVLAEIAAKHGGKPVLNLKRPGPVDCWSFGLNRDTQRWAAEAKEAGYEVFTSLNVGGLLYVSEESIQGPQGRCGECQGPLSWSPGGSYCHYCDGDDGSGGCTT